MPNREKVEAFIALVEQDKFVEAMQQFYTDDATAQENGEPPRVGLENLIAHERAATRIESPNRPPLTARIGAARTRQLRGNRRKAIVPVGPRVESGKLDLGSP